MLELEIIKPKMLEMELLGQAPSNSIIQTQEKEVTPTTNVQEITPDKDYDALSKVTVKAVTNEIDENIKPSNIKLGVSILGVEGNVEPDKPNQSKVATPTTNQQIITADTGYELENVTIEAVTNEIDNNISAENILQGVSILGVEGILKPEKEEEVKTIEIKTNRLTSIKPTEGKTMGEVLVTTAVTPTKGDIDITENGNYDVSDYVGANVNVPIQEPKLQDKTVEITENGTFNIVADNGYDGLNNVEVVTNVASSSNDFIITDGGYLFQSGRRLENLSDLMPFLKPTNCSYMFETCRERILDLRDLDTSDSLYFGSMFSGNTNLITLYVNTWNTSKATDMSWMFSRVGVLTTLDLSGWDTSNVTNMSSMFYNCSKLTTLDIRNFNFTKVSSYNNMFYGVPATCKIIVKDETAKNWVLARRSDLTNVKTVAEL